LLLNTKHNAWLFPAAVLLHFVVVRGAGFLAELRKGRLALPSVWLFMAVVGPLVFVCGWPWLWTDTFQRFTEYVQFHTGHDYYNMEFLGTTYYAPPMPRLYAWVMTLGTVPFITLLLFSIGVVTSLRDRKKLAAPISSPNELGGTWSLRFFWIACLLVAYAPWWSEKTPIFGGTKHWIVAYPFLCLLAGVGFQLVWRGIMPLFSRRYRWLGHALSASMIAGPTWMTLHAHPYALSAYTPLVGGASGAATLGLNRTFWGYTTLSVADYVNRTVPPGGAVYVHDTALQSFRMLTKEGRLRRDLRGTLGIVDSSVALYHHEPHMQRVEQQIWVDYGTTRPAAMGVFDGVPVVWTYGRPGLASNQRASP
jgi:hypothetical protein